MYNFCNDCRLAYRARSESRGVGILHVEGFNGYKLLASAVLQHVIPTRAATSPQSVQFVLLNKETLNVAPKYGFLKCRFLMDDVPISNR